MQEQFLFPLPSFILPHFPWMWFINHFSPRCWLSPPSPCPLFSSLPFSNLYFCGQWGKRAGLESRLNSKRRNVRERKKVGGQFTPPTAWRGHLLWNYAVSATEATLHLSCICMRWGKSPFLQPQTERHCSAFLTQLLVTSLSLMLPLFHWIKIALDLCVCLSMFPDKELATTEARDIKKDKGY